MSGPGTKRDRQQQITERVRQLTGCARTSMAEGNSPLRFSRELVERSVRFREAWDGTGRTMLWKAIEEVCGVSIEETIWSLTKSSRSARRPFKITALPAESNLVLYGERIYEGGPIEILIGGSDHFVKSLPRY